MCFLDIFLSLEIKCIAATLMSTTPVLIIPIVILTDQERVSLRAGFGALVAIAGIALLCLR